MNDEVRALAVKARNGSYEMMLTAQAMKDRAETEAEKRIAEYLYTGAWSSYNLLLELEKQERRTRS
jgi:hypothetical protein